MVDIAELRVEDRQAFEIVPDCIFIGHAIAAVDLGSNSFRMVIADVVDRELRPVDGLREGGHAVVHDAP